MRRSMRWIGLGLVLVLAGAACGSEDGDDAQPASKGSALSPAASLRATLGALLGEHVTLAADATGHALGGRTKEFEAAAGALDDNSRALAMAVDSVYAGTEDRFYGLWKSHVDMVVRYTQAAAKSDRTAQEKEVGNLLAYAKDFGAFLSGANPNLTKDAVADLVTHHITTLKDVIDAQAKGSHAKAYAATRTAYAHMDMIASALADAIARQKSL